jgi:hypothetical protein
VKAEKYFAVGCILIFAGIGLLATIGLFYLVYPTYYGANFDTMRYLISADITLIIVGIGMLAVSFWTGSDH